MIKAQRLKNYQEKKAFSIHHKNIQSLAVEIYRFVNGLSPEIMKRVFHVKENTDTEKCIWTLQSQPKNNKYGAETVLYLAPQIWSIVSQTIKERTSIYSFKTKIMKW